MLKTTVVALISHVSRGMPKILQARLQQYVNCELPDVQTGFRKGRGTGDQIANIYWTSKKQESSRKTSISALLTMPKHLTMWITINCGKFWKRWEYQTTWPASWETCMQVRKQQNRTWNRLAPNRKRSASRLYICQPAYLTYMQSTAWETLDWKKHKLESRLPGEISITSDMQMTPSLWQKVKKN